MATSGLEELFERFRREGDLDALAEVFDRAAEKLLKVARHLCGDEAEAEDVVQATFLAAIEGRDSYEKGRELLPWLTGILTNKAKVARALSSRIPDPGRLTTRASADPAVDAELRDLRSTLDRALERVPDAYRDVLRLHLRDGKEADEIARELGRPAGTVRVQLHRGLKHLRRGLPAGIALSGIGIVIGPRGLAAIRAEVLGHAASVATAAAGTVVATTTVGGVIVGKKIALVVGIAVLASGGIWLASRVRTSTREQSSIPTEVVALSALEQDAAPHLPSSERTRASSATETSTSDVDAYGALDLEWAWPDGTAAAGIGVGAASRGEPQFLDHAQFGWTDENGHITFERLHEGKIVVLTARGCSSENFESSVTGGKRTSAKFSLPAGADVHGKVLDADRRPVPGADVWITLRNDDGGSFETKSAADGSYSIRAVDKSCSIFATADHRGSSLLVGLGEIDPKGPGPIEVDLVLRGESSALAGSVLDPEGKPVAGAWVTLHARATRKGRENLQWPAVWKIAGQDGSFRFDGVHEGRAELDVFVTGFSYWSKDIELEEDRTFEIVVRLDRGFTVRGTVRGSDGQPIADARVSHGAAPGTKGYVYWVRQLATKTAADGSYVLPCVPAGDVELHAESRSSASSMRDATLRTGRTGEVVTWDPVLREGLRIRGRIVDDAGRPLVGWSIEPMPERGGRPGRSGTSDAEGSFVVVDCSEGPNSLYAYPPRNPSISGRIASAIERHVLAGLDDVLITVPHAGEEGGFLVGRLVDSHGGPVTSATVNLQHSKSHQGVFSDKLDEDGSFKLGPVPPGRYRVEVSPKGLPSVLDLAPIDIAAAEIRDIGTIALRPRGRVEVDVKRADGTPPGSQSVFLFTGIYVTPMTSTDGTRYVSDEVYSGTHILRVRGGSIATVMQPIEVRGEETTHVDVVVQDGSEIYLRFPSPPDAGAPDELLVTVSTADGSICLQQEASWDPEPDGSRTRSFAAGFVPGKYVFEARSPEGWTASGSFEISDSKAAPTAIEVPLRRR